MNHSHEVNTAEVNTAEVNTHEVNTERWQSSDLDHLVAAETVLIASDFDGTLSPIVANPADAAPHPGAADALAAVVAAPKTSLAILSGRPYDFLAAIDAIPSEALLVGSHGAEYLAAGVKTDNQLARRMDALVEQMTVVGDAFDGSEIEIKPASVALHYRHVTGDAQALIDAVHAGPSQIEGIETQHGKMVVELAITTANKGTAINQLRTDLEVDAVIYFGDDTTDEDAFAVLGENDLGVRIGSTDTMADVLADDPEDVIAIIAELASRRTAVSDSAA